MAEAGGEAAGDGAANAPVLVEAPPTLTAPAALQVGLRGDTFVELAWEAVLHAHKYHVQHYAAGLMSSMASWRDVEPVGRVATVRVRAHNLAAGTGYYFRVRAVTEAGVVGPAIVSAEPVYTLTAEQDHTRLRTLTQLQATQVQRAERRVHRAERRRARAVIAAFLATRWLGPRRARSAARGAKNDAAEAESEADAAFTEVRCVREELWEARAAAQAAEKAAARAKEDADRAMVAAMQEAEDSARAEQRVATLTEENARLAQEAAEATRAREDAEAGAAGTRREWMDMSDAVGRAEAEAAVAVAAAARGEAELAAARAEVVEAERTAGVAEKVAAAERAEWVRERTVVMGETRAALVLAAECQLATRKAEAEVAARRAEVEDMEAEAARLRHAALEKDRARRHAEEARERAEEALAAALNDRTALRAKVEGLEEAANEAGATCTALRTEVKHLHTLVREERARLNLMKAEMEEARAATRAAQEAAAQAEARCDKMRVAAEVHATEFDKLYNAYVGGAEENKGLRRTCAHLRWRMLARSLQAMTAARVQHAQMVTACVALATMEAEPGLRAEPEAAADSSSGSEDEDEAEDEVDSSSGSEDEVDSSSGSEDEDEAEDEVDSSSGSEDEDEAEDESESESEVDSSSGSEDEAEVAAAAEAADAEGEIEELTAEEQQEVWDSMERVYAMLGAHAEELDVTVECGEEEEFTQWVLDRSAAYSGAVELIGKLRMRLAHVEAITKWLEAGGAGHPRVQEGDDDSDVSDSDVSDVSDVSDSDDSESDVSDSESDVSDVSDSDDSESDESDSDAGDSEEAWARTRDMLHQLVASHQLHTAAAAVLQRTRAQLAETRNALAATRDRFDLMHEAYLEMVQWSEARAKEDKAVTAVLTKRADTLTSDVATLIAGNAELRGWWTRGLMDAVSSVTPHGVAGRGGVRAILVNTVASLAIMLSNAVRVGMFEHHRCGTALHAARQEAEEQGVVLTAACREALAAEDGGGEEGDATMASMWMEYMRTVEHAVTVLGALEEESEGEGESESEGEGEEVVEGGGAANKCASAQGADADMDADALSDHSSLPDLEPDTGGEDEADDDAAGERDALAMYEAARNHASPRVDADEVWATADPWALELDVVDVSAAGDDADGDPWMEGASVNVGGDVPPHTWTWPAHGDVTVHIGDAGEDEVKTLLQDTASTPLLHAARHLTVSPLGVQRGPVVTRFFDTSSTEAPTTTKAVTTTTVAGGTSTAWLPPWQCGSVYNSLPTSSDDEDEDEEGTGSDLEDDDVFLW